MTIKNNDIEPDWVVTPGEIIEEHREAYGWTQAGLAQRLGCSEKHLNQVINAKVALSPNLAESLATVFDTSVGFWLNLETLYQQDLQRQKRREKLAKERSWLKKFPCTELRKRGFIKGTLRDVAGLADECLRHFGVATITEFQQLYGVARFESSYAFRVSQKRQPDPYAIAAWLREGERSIEEQSQDLRDVTYEPGKLQKVIDELARSTREITSETFVETVHKALASVGVGFALIPHYPRAAVSGAAAFHNQGLPYVFLSDYGKSMDKLWFNLFHELGHILLHLTSLKDRKQRLFLDLEDRDQPDTQEEEADAFARNTLIPEEHVHHLPTLTTKDRVEVFSQALHVHPGIVVGRLQHEGVIAYHEMNEMKERFG